MLTIINCLYLVLTISISLISLSLSSTTVEDKMSMLKNEQSRIMSALSGSNMTSLEIQASRDSEAEFRFGSLNNFYALTARGESKDFVISNGQRPILEVDDQNNIKIFPKGLEAQDGLTFTGEYKIRNIPQWRLVLEEDFSSDPVGWTNNTVTECGGVRMLGGYCQFGGGEVFKVFNNIPKHSKLRIQATYHFIDAWDSETGFMRVNNGKDGEMQYLWIERYSAFVGNNGINVCGGRWPEGKFASPIDVVIPHKSSSIKIGFGATIEQDPCDESFGVSGIRIYIR